MPHLELGSLACDKRPRMARGKRGAPVDKPISQGKRAYESRRAAKAGMSLEKWLEFKERQAASRARESIPERPATKKPGLFSRLLEKAQRPL